MRKRILISFFGSFILTSFLVTNANAQCGNVGIYYWGGSLATADSSTIIPMAKALADSLGVNSIAFTLACDNDAVYRGTSYCTIGTNLTAMASRPDFNSIITDPQFTTEIITAYDWVSYGNCDSTYFLDTAFYTPSNTLAIENEYTNLANYLATFPTKNFIIMQWEADNQCYCGSAYSDPTCPSAPANIAGFTKWMNARAAGINAAHVSNVKVGIEFNNIHSLEAAGKPDILDTVIPYIYCDYYLYSSYESINVSPAQTASDIVFIRKKLASFGKDSNALLFGEMGFPGLAWGRANAADSLQQIINVVNEYNIPISIVWTLLDDPTSYATYDSLGNITPIGSVVKGTVCPVVTTTDVVKDNSLKLSIMPNPNEGEFYLDFTAKYADNYTIEIRNVLGQIIYTQLLKNHVGTYENKISVADAQPGVYFIEVKGSSKLVVQKLIVY
jgi:Secretion system C-terminal sorting domain